MNFYAHTSGNNKTNWEPLFTPDCPALKGQPCAACQNLHLNKVAHLASLWHDLGK